MNEIRLTDEGEDEESRGWSVLPFHFDHCVDACDPLVYNTPLLNFIILHDPSVGAPQTLGSLGLAIKCSWG